MNFLKSVFSDDPDSPESKTSTANKDLVEPDRDSSQIEHRSDVSPSSHAAPAGGGWNFEGLIRTLSSKSETIIDTYRRDLKEFGSGLKKEIEVAQGSLGTVGIAIDEFGNSVIKGTAQIISQGKEAILAEFDSDNNSSSQKYSSEKGLNSKRYSRFDAQVRAIQGDACTYCDEPECLNDYNKWKSEFSLEGKSKEIESCLRENDAMEGIYKRVVPNTVDHETFWFRYYYKVYKLKKAEDVRARLVRGMSREEEELSWDVEDDDDDEEHESKGKPNFVTNKEVDGEDVGKKADAKLQDESCAIGNKVETKKSNVEEVQNSSRESAIESRDNVLQNKDPDTKAGNFVEEPNVENSEVLCETGENSSNADSGSKESIKEAGGDKASKTEGYTSLKKNVSVAKSDDKVITEKKADDGKASNKDNDSSLASSHLSSPDDEEDLGWDEIEDLSSIDEKRGTKGGSPNNVDPRKRLSVAAEEDLSWDIEDDDDEPTKA